MQIELVGCTSAGKTTLARRMVKVGQAVGIDVQLSDDFLLACIGLNWISNEFIRRRIIELWALLTCLLFLRKYRALYRFIIRICFQTPGSWLYRIKLARVTLRKIGIHEIIRRRSTDRQAVLLDNEGILQASHTLFVHASGPSSTDCLADFLRLMPLPDVIAYLKQPEQLLIERTRARGHNRIPEESDSGEIASFISQAVQMFEQIRGYPGLADRLLVIDGERNLIEPREAHADPLLEWAADLIRAGLAHAPASNQLDAGHTSEYPALKAIPTMQQ